MNPFSLHPVAAVAMIIMVSAPCEPVPDRSEQLQERLLERQEAFLEALATRGSKEAAVYFAGKYLLVSGRHEGEWLIGARSLSSDETAPGR